jgi:hypothetical protein
MDTFRLPAALLLGTAALLVGLGTARPDETLPPAAMPRDHAGPRPKPRAAAEVEAVLAGAPSPPEKVRPLRVVLVAGKKDHGKGEHDYPAWQKAWAALLGRADQVEVATAWEWPERTARGPSSWPSRSVTWWPSPPSATAGVPSSTRTPAS